VSLIEDGELALAMSRKLVDVLLELVPGEVARDMLTEAAIKRANDAADAAERIKFGHP